MSKLEKSVSFNSAPLLKTGVADFRLPCGESIVFSDADGPYVWDSHGRRYLDLILGFGPVVLGHCHARFVNMMRDYLSKPMHLPGYGETHLEYVAKLRLKMGNAEGFALFKQSSDAVTAAIRLANAATGRRGIIRAGFMGWHDLQLANSPSWHEFLDSPYRARTKNHAAFYPPHPTDRIFDWTDLHVGSLVDELEQHPESYSVFVLDPVQLAYAKPKSIAIAVNHLKSFGVTVIYDETKTGGRQDRQCAYHKLGLPEPDLIILGKAIANGAPLSVLATIANYEPLFQQIRAGGTHSKELTAVYAALSTLQCMNDIDGYTTLARCATLVADELNAGFKEGGISDLIQAFCFADALIIPRPLSELQGNANLRELLQRKLAANGVLIRLGHPAFVSTSHDQVALGDLSNRVAQASIEFAKEM